MNYMISDKCIKPKLIESLWTFFEDDHLFAKLNYYMGVIHKLYF